MSWDAADAWSAIRRSTLRNTAEDATTPRAAFSYASMSDLDYPVHYGWYSEFTLTAVRLRYLYTPTMASADFSQFVVTTADETACMGIGRGNRGCGE